jgi:CheY-like chemotaxis protein
LWRKNGKIALDVLDLSYRLIISDIMMPHMTVLRYLLLSRGDIELPIFVITLKEV